MQKLQRTWTDISTELNQRLAECRLSPKELSQQSGIGYDAARRYLLSCKIKNNNDNAKKLCAFFDIRFTENVTVPKASLEKMARTIREVWDGTKPHAELIVNLIKTTKPFKIDGRN